MAATGDAHISGPLHGFLAEEHGETVEIVVADGTWSIPAAAATISEWHEPAWQGHGRAVVVTVAPDTAVIFTKRYSVVAAGQPMTLSDETVELLGSDKLEQMARAWAVAPIWNDEVVKPEPTTTWEYTWLRGEDTPYDGIAIDHDD
jgi:hypothetical protein